MHLDTLQYKGQMSIYDLTDRTELVVEAEPNERSIHTLNTRRITLRRQGRSTPR